MKNTTRLAVYILCLFAAVTISSSAWATYRPVFPEHSDVKLVASVPQLAEVAKSIGGRHVIVFSLLKSSENTKDPKLYDNMAKATKEDPKDKSYFQVSLDSYLKSLSQYSNKTQTNDNHNQMTQNKENINK